MRVRERVSVSKNGERKADRDECKIKHVIPVHVLRKATVEIVVFGTHPSLPLCAFSAEGTGNADGVCYVWCACVVCESVSYLKTARGSLNDMLSWCVPFCSRGNCHFSSTQLDGWPRVSLNSERDCHVTEMTSQFKSDLNRHINLDACHLLYNTTPQAQSIQLGCSLKLNWSTVLGCLTERT